MFSFRPSTPAIDRIGLVRVALIATVLLWAHPGLTAEVWPVGGVRVSPPSISSQLGKVTSDGAGGVIVAYSHNVGAATLMVTRVDATGVIAWGPVEICPSANQPSDHVITADGAGGAVIAWEDRRAGDDPMVYAQRINREGATLWAAGGIPVCSLGGSNVEPIIAPDGTGGAIIAWRIPTLAGSHLHAQRLLADGSVAPGWSPTAGVPVCSVNDETVSYHVIAPDGNSGAVLAWVDSRSLANDAVYANLVSGNGVVVWATDGIAVASDEDIDYRQPSIVSDGAGGAIIAYRESTWYTDEYTIHTRRINGAGQTQWDSELCSIAFPDQLEWTWSAPDRAGGAVVAWRQRSGGAAGPVDIHARRVNAGGTPLWPNCGVQVSTLGGCVNSRVSIAMDGSGGAILTWYDRTDGWYVLTQHLDGAGNPLWQAGGLDLDPGADHPFGPVVTTDGLGGGLYAWDGDCGVWCVYAQRVNSIGIFGDGFETGDTSAW